MKSYRAVVVRDRRLLFLPFDFLDSEGENCYMAHLIDTRKERGETKLHRHDETSLIDSITGDHLC